MKYDFEFTKFLIEQLAEKTIASSQKLASLSLLSVNDKVLYCIYSHYIKGDLESLNKKMVCDEMFIPLRSLNRSIVESKKSGYLEFKAKQFKILSIEKLEEHFNEII